MQQEEIKKMITDFGKNIGLPELTFDENGYLCLMFDDVVVNIEAMFETEQLFFYTNIGEIPHENKEAFYEMLLTANYFFKETAGGTIGIDKNANIISLAYQLPFTSLTTNKLEKTVENFINVAENWINKIKTFQHQETMPSSSYVLPQGIRA
ncbi:MAG: type III secretion system chaperone [Desulfobacterales bacterium]|nr:type III secretion system chaperone [Desulfobacterales bacterium]